MSGFTLRRHTRRASHRPSWRTVLPVAASGALGALVMFLTDPDRGRRRRATARDRSAAFVRHSARRAGRIGLRSKARVSGMIRRARHLSHRPEPPANDQTLTDRILSQAFRGLDVPTHRININVEEGIAVLHGEVERADQIQTVQTAIRRIPGVRDVASYLHLPGTPAPGEGPRG